MLRTRKKTAETPYDFRRRVSAGFGDFGFRVSVGSFSEPGQVRVRLSTLPRGQAKPGCIKQKEQKSKISVAEAYYHRLEAPS